MVGMFLLTLFFICLLILAIAHGADKWSQFRREHLNNWLRTVHNGLCDKSSGHPDKIVLDGEPCKIVCRVQSTPFLLFLAKRTRLRVVKYNESFFTEIKTWGSEWTEFNVREYGTWNKSNRFDTLDQAEAAIAQTVANIQCWIDNSVPEDPNKYKRVVVAQHTVTEKETK